MMPMSLRAMAAALGGEVSGKSILGPGPGHSAKDRSQHHAIGHGARWLHGLLARGRRLAGMPGLYPGEARALALPAWASAKGGAATGAETRRGNAREQSRTRAAALVSGARTARNTGR